MKIKVWRFCLKCGKNTHFIIEAEGKYWERHICTKCGRVERYKTT
jgi:ribosomal protein S27AE